MAPRFEDPPASPNFAPTVVDSQPHVGSFVQPGLTLEVSVTDANVRDTLYVRWVSDYPFATADSRVLTDVRTIAPSSDGTTHVVASTYQIDCTALAPSINNVHRIVVIIADRPFKKPDDSSLSGTAANLRYELVDADDDSTHVVTATWFLAGCS